PLSSTNTGSWERGPARAWRLAPGQAAVATAARPARAACPAGSRIAAAAGPAVTAVSVISAAAPAAARPARRRACARTVDAMFCPPPECVPFLVFVAATPFGLIARNPLEQIHRGAGPPSAQP